ncbi:amidohydrolase [Kineobactrum sediminis]|uniref:Amidohydrolase n=1 Tax=Kineobactrum sediminis TaxID=1905677 RepID=A0A2N5Y0V5_9GAMM|nr:amidohydrolase [Kineobactrum sediminis]PLW82035.1 amidohydrolase [Kineobactrum sediminis]
MRPTQWLLVPALAVFCTAPIHAADRPDLEAALHAIEPKVIDWRRDLHANPELSNREFRTADKVAAHLRSLEFDEVITGVAHTGVVGTLKGGKPGPVIALRADMDALPVLEQTGLPFASKARGEYLGKDVPVMHACGHDTHVAMLMGAAEVLAQNREHLAGTVKFIFQPAEEGPPGDEEGGASMMIKEGVLAGPDAPEAIIGLHVWPDDSGSLVYRSGSFMAASDSLDITVTGRQTHGSSPWLGVDPIYVAGQILSALQGIPGRHVDITRGPAVITIGSIQGGIRGNIIPEEVKMAGTIRTFDMGERDRLHERLRATVTGIAEANGASASVTLGGGTPVTGNDPQLLREMMPTLVRAAGEGRVVEGNLITGAEDFSYYQQEIPGLFLMLGVGDPDVPRAQRPSNHSPLFDADEDALIVGVRTLVGFALDYPARAR